MRSFFIIFSVTTGLLLLACLSSGYTESKLNGFSESELNGFSHSQASKFLEYRGIIVKLKSPAVLEYREKILKDLESEEASWKKMKFYEKYTYGLFTKISAGLRKVLLPLQLRNYGKKLKIEHRELKEKLEEELGGRVTAEYYSAFNGFALDAPYSSSEEFEAEDFEVYPDYKAELMLTDTVNQIGAVDSWDYGFTGKGVKVAVIDSGIDYTHGGFGGCTYDEVISRSRRCEKIADAYNFLDHNRNVTDVLGHGTHVAGIVSSKLDINENGVCDEGDICGVAPDSTLYVYKVGNRKEDIYTSNIIAAIDRALDPNGDFNYEDRVDVVLTSLGTFTYPDFPLSIAADNAAKLGTVVVGAAGNSGEKDIVVAPGSARLAISVGSVNKEDEFMDYSSRGPLIWENKAVVKPDVLAPGGGPPEICFGCSSKCCMAEHGILSTINSGERWDCLGAGCGTLIGGEKYIKALGTSEAAPHVAGEAALLRQKHPEWSALQIKAAIENSAIDLGYPISEQGHGRVDIRRALRLKNPIYVNISNDYRVYKKTTIKGYINSDTPLRYSLKVFEEEWRELTKGIGKGNIEIEIDTEKLRGGTNYIELEVTNDEGETYSAYSVLYVVNAYISFPDSNYAFGDTKLKVKGNAISSNLDHYVLRVKTEQDVIGLTEKIDEVVHTGHEEVIEGVLGEIDVTNLPAGTFGAVYTLDLKIYDSDNNIISEYSTTFHKAVRGEWSHVKLWPLIMKTPIMSTHVDDIYPRQGEETAVVYNYDTREIYIGVLNSAGSLIWAKKYDKIGGDFFEPAIHDLNGDGIKEIIVGGGDGMLHIFGENGEEIEGWPKPMGEADLFSVMVDTTSQKLIVSEKYNNELKILPYTGNYNTARIYNPGQEYEIVSTALGDVIGDGKNEVVALVKHNNQGYIHVLNTEALPIMKVRLPEEDFKVNSVALADFGSGLTVIVTGTKLHLLKLTSTSSSTSSTSTSSTSTSSTSTSSTSSTDRSSTEGEGDTTASDNSNLNLDVDLELDGVAVGDVDSDGKPEIVGVGTSIYVVDVEGTEVVATKEIPVDNPDDSILVSPIIADVDNDNQMEIITALKNTLLVYDISGLKYSANYEGIQSVGAYEEGGITYILVITAENLYLWTQNSPGKLEWPTKNYDNWNTRHYNFATSEKGPEPTLSLGFYPSCENGYGAETYNVGLYLKEEIEDEIKEFKMRGQAECEYVNGIPAEFPMFDSASSIVVGLEKSSENRVLYRRNDDRAKALAEGLVDVISPETLEAVEVGCPTSEGIYYHVICENPGSNVLIQYEFDKGEYIARKIAESILQAVGAY